MFVRASSSVSASRPPLPVEVVLVIVTGTGLDSVVINPVIVVLIVFSAMLPSAPPPTR
jgi:hypothetical protein